MTIRTDAVMLAASLVLASLAAALTHGIAGDPFTGATQTICLIVGLTLAAGLVALRLSGRRVVTGAVGAVAVSVWMAFFCAWQLAGTPYPYGGNIYDIGRLTALATRFTVATGSADQFVPHLPSDYPPLFPWLVGKAAVVTGIPAWQLIGLSGVVFAALAVTAAYVLWRRVVSAPLALAVCAIPAAYQGDPRKAYEVMALCVVIPWILTTFGVALISIDLIKKTVGAEARTIPPLANSIFGWKVARISGVAITVPDVLLVVSALVAGLVAFPQPLRIERIDGSYRLPGFTITVAPEPSRTVASRAVRGSDSLLRQTSA